MLQKLVQNFYNKKQGLLEVTKATPKIEKYVYYIFTENICSTRNPMQVVVYCKHLLTLYKNDSNSLTLKVALYLKIYMVKFKVSILNRLKIMLFL